MEYRVLGQLEVRRGGESLELGSFKQRSLLALLLIHRNEVLSTDRIIDEIWGVDSGSDRKNALHVYLSNLRKILEPDRSGRGEGSILLTRHPGYSIRTRSEEVDSDRFENALAEGRALIPTDPGSASIVLGEALAYWRGLPYEEFVYESFAQTEIDRLNELRLEAVEARVDADLARGLAGELVGELESLVRENPLRERLTGQLMIALYRSGRQADALRAYQSLAGRLGEELGIDPGNELKSLEEKIVLGDSSLLASGSAPLPGDGSAPGMAVRGYELRERLGSGRFGIAYKAFQPAVGREVAVKVIRPELADDPRFVRAFEDEAQLVARLEHPNIVPLYDYWREPGAAYLVMRLMQGGSLENALSSGPLTEDRAASLVAQVGAALDAAHRSGVIHHDIKPSNILIDADGNAYLSDFGVAVGLKPGAENTTPAPTLEPPYASPESRKNDGVSPTSDIYSLAVVTAEALTGRRGEIAELMVGMSPALVDVLSTATSTDPAARPPSVEDFVEAVLGALEAEAEEHLSAARRVKNPYKGLRAFQQADAGDFFGRDRMVERLVARLGNPGVQGRFVAVVGPSGSGKSSLVKAGLLPALRRGGAPGSASWYQIDMTPGQHPFSELEDALLGVAVNPPASLIDELSTKGGFRKAVERVLPDQQASLVVLIDQFEELYTLTDSLTRDRFLEAVLDAITEDKSRVRLVATLRADFYDRPLSHRAFGELLRHATELVTPMSAEEMERAVTGPARRVGVEFESAVVAEIVNDVTDRPGALPLLQYALTELFEKRSGPTITPAVYHSIGGVAGALGDRAESLYNGLDRGARDAARQIFLRLVALGEGSEDTRRRVLLSEIESLEGVSRHARSIVDTFARHRLLSFDRDPVSRSPTVEISHEALLREWSRFHRWIEEGRSDVRAQRRLAAAAAEWKDRGESADYVLIGARLSRYDGWLEKPPVELTVDEQRFLQASQTVQRDLEEQEKEREREQEQFRRRARILAALTVVTVLVVALGVFAFIERQRAESLAEEIAIDGRVYRLTIASVSRLQDDPELSAMLAIEAARASSSKGIVLPEAMDALHASIQASNSQYPVGPVAPVAVRGLGAGPTGVFAMPPDDLIDFAQSEVSRGLTPSECANLFPNEICPDPTEPLPSGLVIEGDYETASGPQPLAGTTVTIGSPLLGNEADLLRASLASISESTGIRIVLEEQVFPNIVPAVLDGEPLDIAIIPQPAAAETLVSEERLMDLTGYLDSSQLKDAVGDYLMQMVTVGDDGTWPSDDGGVYGVWIKVDNKSLIWHPSPEFEEAGYEPPGTWPELLALSDELVEEGTTPWCLGIAAGEASGWPATDWVESIVLRTEGPEFYDRWVKHEIPFDHPAVVDAARMIAGLAYSDGYVSPGAAFVADRLWSEAMFMISENPPPCWLGPYLSAAPGLSPALSPGEAISMFDFPTMDPRYADTIVGGGVFAAAITDRPEVRAVMEALASSEFGAEWARSGGGYISPHREFDLDNYPNPVERRIAELTREAIIGDGFRFDASDLMPPGIGSADQDGAALFWDGMLRLFREGPAAADEIMADIEAGWLALENEEDG